MRPSDLRDTDALLKLYQQAVEAELIAASTGGRVDFLAFAERARANGDRPGVLFTWLLNGKTPNFLNDAHDDAAAARLREHNYGPDPRKRWPQNQGPGLADQLFGGGGERPRDVLAELTDEEKMVPSRAPRARSRSSSERPADPIAPIHLCYSGVGRPRSPASLR